MTTDKALALNSEEFLSTVPGTLCAHVVLMTDSCANYDPGHDIRARTFEFACRVVEFCKSLYDQGGVARQMTGQLVNCSTSTAAMLEEARGAESRRDFISKCSISLKEARESHVRLRVCYRCSLGPHDQSKRLIDEAQQIAAILGAIVRNTRRNAGIAVGRASGSKLRARSL